MKLRIVLICALVLCIGVSVISTVAYFTAEDTARNVITAGSLDIDVIQEQINEDGEIVPFSQGAVPLLPGAKISNIVSVKNNDADAYIRIKLNIVVKNAEGEVIDADGLISTLTSNEMWLTNDSDDGWLYYKEPVKTGELTLPVIDGIEYSRDMDNKYQKATAEIYVTAEAVQVANNGDDVFSAQGWPEEN